MPKFKDGAQVRLVDRSDGCSTAVLEAVDAGIELFIRNDGTSMPEIVDSQGQHIAHSHESRYELVSPAEPAEHPALVKAKAEVARLTGIGYPNLSDHSRGMLNAYSVILERFGLLYRKVEPPPPPAEYRFVSTLTGKPV